MNYFYNTHEIHQHEAIKEDKYGDWRVNGESLIYDLQNYEHLLTQDRLKTVSFEDIAFKGKHFTNLRGQTCLCCDGSRYYSANIKFPGILVENMENPYNLKYRLIDGKHRIEKMINLGMTTSQFYILKISEL